MKSILGRFFELIISERKKLTNASTGSDFEERIKTYLRRVGISERTAEDEKILADYLKKIKPKIQSKTGFSLLNNELYQSTNNLAFANFYIWQPYGKQDYPDFLVFTEHKVFSLEIKYSTENSKKPMWNGNLPKRDALYIFGVYGKQDLTVFRGGDILSDQERAKILELWDGINDYYSIWEQQFISEISDGNFLNQFGFSPYVRRAYQQNKKYNPDAVLDYLDNPQRTKIEKSLIDYIDKSDV